MSIDKSVIRLVASYVVGVIVLCVAGYLVITTGTIPEQWMTLVTGFCGLVFIADGIERTLQVYNSRKG